MMLNAKLKELRTARGLTQEAVADYLDISSQTVSKWERGLLSPDVKMLPRLAVLYKTSIDSMFEMESCWDEEHNKNYKDKLHALCEKKDYESAYRTMITEIELKPERFEYYCDVMLFVLRRKMFDDAHTERMLKLTEYAENYCHDDDIRNEIHRVMLQICSYSENPQIKEKALLYYQKLPMLRHSREVYAEFVMNQNQSTEQYKKNIMYTLDLAECAIRKLIRAEMPDAEKLLYYRRAAGVYENILDGQYAGFYDVPLACDYAEIAKLLCTLGRKEEAVQYLRRFFSMIRKQFSDEKLHDLSVFIAEPNPVGSTSAEVSYQKLLQHMETAPELSEVNNEIKTFSLEFEECMNKRCKL